MNKPTSIRQIRLERRSPSYWRVTFDLPPLNIFGPLEVPKLETIIKSIETDERVKVVVFDSAIEGFFLTHYDFLAKLEETTSLPLGATGLQPLPDMLARLSRAPVVSIASIRGRATGVGSELALASDLRFASREKAILSQWEVGAGMGRIHYFAAASCHAGENRQVDGAWLSQTRRCGNTSRPLRWPTWKSVAHNRAPLTNRVFHGKIDNQR